MSKQLYDGIAESYNANRAGYPHQLIEQFRAACRMPEGGGIVVDENARLHQECR